MQAHGFRFYFTPLHGVLPTFPSRYWSAIGLRQSLALRDGPRGFGQDSTCPALLRCRIGLPRLARTGVSPSAPSLSRKFRFVRQSISPVLQPRHVREHDGLGSSLFDRHYWGNRLFLSPPPGTKMFQFPGFAPAQLVPGLQPGGLPHSGIRGSFRICRSPRLFAAYHALRRLREPQASAVRPFLVSLDLPVSIIRRRRSLCVALLCFLLLLFCPICQ